MALIKEQRGPLILAVLIIGCAFLYKWHTNAEFAKKYPPLKSTQFFIQGTITNNLDSLQSAKIYYYYNIGERFESRIDSVPIVNNTFTIIDTLQYPSWIILSNKKAHLWYSPIMNPNLNAFFYIDPRGYTHFEVDLNDWENFTLAKPEGKIGYRTTQQDFTELREELNPIWLKMKKISETVDYPANIPLIDSLEHLQVPIILRFIKNHPQSYISLSYVKSIYDIAPEEEHNTIDSLLDNLYQERRVKFIRERANQFKYVVSEAKRYRRLFEAKRDEAEAYKEELKTCQEDNP